MTPIDEALEYIYSEVLRPAIQSPLLSEKIRRKVKNTEIWLTHFQRIGDLLIYLKRFEASKNDPVFTELKKLNLRTFEDIVVEFEEKFILWSQDFTRVSDFIIGENYSSHQILIFAKTYDTRSGGMFVLKSGGQVSSVIIKATLSGGRYANSWISEPNQLKYYLKSISNNFSERYKPNAAILDNHSIPILTFVRNSSQNPFTYQGIFNYHSIHSEADGSKWFNLIRATQQPRNILVEASFVSKILMDEIKLSSELSPEQRHTKLKIAPRIPERVQVISMAFIRNPHVIAEVLIRAGGICESCKQIAPFNKRSDSSPYLEVHHKIPLAEGGDDTVENALAICPNCHRKAHFG